MQQPQNSWHKIGLSIVHALCIFLLLFVFFSNRSLFLDGLNLARNVAEGSFVDLTRPLNYEQSAPILFLFISKIATLIFGVSEFSLRLLPLLSGFACLYFFGKVLNHFLDSKLVLLGILWLGTHSMFVRYATEYKQYITDTFICIFLIWLALSIKKLNIRNLILIAIAGTISIWFSMPSIFVLFGFVCYFLVIQHNSNKSLVPIVLLGIWFLFNFALEYFLVLSPAIESDHMQNFHQNYFLEGKIWSLESIKHDLGLINSTLRMAVGKSAIAIALASILILFSAFEIIKKKRKIGLLLLLPLVAVCAASLLGKYSLIERLMLFTLPILLTLMLLGFQFVVEQLKEKSIGLKYSIFLLIGLGFVVGFAQTQGLKFMFKPLEIEDNRSALIHISNHEKNMNSIICTQLAYPAYSYYTFYDKNYKNLEIGKASAGKYGESIAQLAVNKSKKDKKEVWVLMGHMLESEISNLISELEKEGSIKNSYRTKRSAAILFSTQ